MDRNSFYRLLGEAVRYCPVFDLGGQQLQTFAVVRSLADLNGESLGRSLVDRFKDYFFSRRWDGKGYQPEIEYDFPVVLVIDRAATYRKAFEPTDRTICPDFQLAVLYPDIERIDSTIAARCQVLGLPGIYQLTESMLMYLIEYIRGAVFATTSLIGTPNWYNRSFLDWQVDEEVITGYTVDALSSNFFLKRMQVDNLNAPLNYHDDISVHKLCGTSISLRICARECGSGVAPVFADAVNCCGKSITVQ